jgi:hypothetical protein
LSHLAGLRESGRFNSLTVVLGLPAVLLFVTFGLARAHLSNWMPFLPAFEIHADGSAASCVVGRFAPIRIAVRATQCSE